MAKGLFTFFLCLMAVVLVLLISVVLNLYFPMVAQGVFYGLSCAIVPVCALILILLTIIFWKR